jgi:NADH-quinone oxidoreductase E subunit
VSLPVSPELDRQVDDLLTRFPQRGSALLPALHLIQAEKGSIPLEAMDYVAGKIGVSPAFVAGVVSFYTMYQQKPIGRHHIQVCCTLPCALRGARSIMGYLEKALGIRRGGTTPDGKFTLSAAECLGTCDTAPMFQINEEEYGQLDERRIDAILASLK